MYRIRFVISVKRFLPILIITLLFSYDLLTYLSDSFTIVDIKIAYYSFLVLLYILYIVKTQRKGKIHFFPRDKFFIVILTFCLMYLLRVVYDLYALDIVNRTYSHKFTYIFLLFNSIFIPLFTLKMIDYNEVNLDKLQFFILIVVLLSLITSFEHVMVNSLINGFSSRPGANKSLDTISYGHLGITLFFLGFAFFIKNPKLIIRIFNLGIMLFGLLSAVIANSRSPFVALIIIVLFYSILTKRVKIISILFVVLLSGWFIAIHFSAFQPIERSFENRMDSSLTDKVKDVTSGRKDLYRIGLTQFYDNPILGSSFLIQKGFFRGEYVHNLIIGAFMSVGIIGGLLYIYAIIITIKRATMLIGIDRKYFFWFAFFIQYLVFSMFSRSILSMPLFWLSMFLVNNLYIYEKNSSLPANSFSMI